VANGYTSLPTSVESFGRESEWLSAAALGRTLPGSNPLRQSLAAYFHGVGIDGGYAFFAPGVPYSYKVIFEIHYPNGDVDYDLPHITERAMAVRLSTLLDYIGRTEHDSLRELMLKMLTYAIWQSHPGATTVRAIFGYIEEPSAAEVSKGKKESYKVLYAYDFSLSSSQPEPQRP
jgi:hypothetical protein